MKLECGYNINIANSCVSALLCIFASLIVSAVALQGSLKFRNESTLSTLLKLWFDLRDEISQSLGNCSSVGRGLDVYEQLKTLFCVSVCVCIQLLCICLLLSTVTFD